ncbi:50S ribosomal protein L4 [candidate division KSB1 bacterium]|nr:MAG: 50S ribosomal protein L4 [candidate division KSB1 bacterium]
MQLPVYKRDGSKTNETVEIPEGILAVEPNDHAIWLAVRSEEAAQRQGTAATKTRSYVRGGGKKPFRQKGRGMARQGTIRSPLNPGGSTIFGPQPHGYCVKLTEKTKKLARRSAFIYKARADKIRVVEDFSLETPRTREIAGLLEALGLRGERVLLLTPDFDGVIARSVRNLYKTEAQKADVASTRDLMNCTTLLVQKSAVSKLVQVFDHAA